MSNSCEHYLKLKEESDRQDSEYEKIEKELSDMPESDYLDFITPQKGRLFHRVLIPNKEEMWKRYGTLIERRGEKRALRKNANDSFVEFRERLIYKGLQWDKEYKEI